MRYFVFCFFIIAITACKQKYTVTAKLTDNRFNGKMVYLETYVNDKVIDSTKIIAESFTMTGNIKAPDFVKVKVEGNNKVITDFILENTDIELEINPDSRKKSRANSPINRVFDEYKAEDEKQIGLLYEKISTIPQGGEKGDIKVNQYYREYIDKKISSLDVNKKTVIGAYILADLLSYLKYDEVRNNYRKLGRKALNTSYGSRLGEILINMERVKEGSKFVDFEAFTPDSGVFKLSNYVGKGKYVLLYFWTSRGAPYNKKQIVELHEKYKNHMQIVGISLDTDIDKWTQAIVECEFTWPQANTFEGQKSKPVEIYCIQKIPSTILIDKNGIIVDTKLDGIKLINKLAEIFEY